MKVIIIPSIHVKEVDDSIINKYKNYTWLIESYNGRNILAKIINKISKNYSFFRDVNSVLEKCRTVNMLTKYGYINLIDDLSANIFKNKKYADKSNKIIRDGLKYYPKKKSEYSRVLENNIAKYINSNIEKEKTIIVLIGVYHVNHVIDKIKSIDKDIKIFVEM